MEQHQTFTIDSVVLNIFKHHIHVDMLFVCQQWLKVFLALENYPDFTNQNVLTIPPVLFKHMSFRQKISVSNELSHKIMEPICETLKPQYRVPWQEIFDSIKSPQDVQYLLSRPGEEWNEDQHFPSSEREMDDFLIRKYEQYRYFIYMNVAHKDKIAVRNGLRLMADEGLTLKSTWDISRYYTFELLSNRWNQFIGPVDIYFTESIATIGD